MLRHVGRPLGDEADFLFRPEHEFRMKRHHARAEVRCGQEVLLCFGDLLGGPDFQSAGRLRAIPFHLAGNVIEDEPAEAVGHDQRQAMVGEGAGRLVHPLARASGGHNVLATVVVGLVGNQFHSVSVLKIAGSGGHSNRCRGRRSARDSNDGLKSSPILASIPAQTSWLGSALHAQVDEQQLREEQPDEYSGPHACKKDGSQEQPVRRSSSGLSLPIENGRFLPSRRNISRPVWQWQVPPGRGRPLVSNAAAPRPGGRQAARPAVTQGPVPPYP